MNGLSWLCGSNFEDSFSSKFFRGLDRLSEGFWLLSRLLASLEDPSLFKNRLTLLRIFFSLPFSLAQRLAELMSRNLLRNGVKCVPRKASYPILIRQCSHILIDHLRILQLDAILHSVCIRDIELVLKYRILGHINLSRWLLHRALFPCSSEDKLGFFKHKFDWFLIVINPSFK